MLTNEVRKEYGNNLVNAVLANNLDAVKAILETNPELIDFQDKDGATASIKAAWFNHADILRYLITKNPNLEKKTSTGINALHCAASYGWRESIEILLENKVQVDSLLHKETTPLLNLVKESIEERQVKRYLSSAKMLVHYKADINFQNEFGYGILRDTTNDEIFDFLLTNKPNLELTNLQKYGRTVLLSFCAKPTKNWHKIHQLIKNGANVNAKDSQGDSAFSLLLKKCEEDNKEQVKETLKLLLAAPTFDHSLIINATQDFAASEAQLAVLEELGISTANIPQESELISLYKQKKHSELFIHIDQLNLKLKEKIHDLDQNGNTLLICAIKDGQWDVALRLIPFCNLTIHNKKDESALSLACAHREIALIQALLKAGADPNEKNKQGVPLFREYLYTKRVAKILISHGKIDLSFADEDGDTYLMHLAKAHETELVMELLMQYKQQKQRDLINATNKIGQTALHIAVNEGIIGDSYDYVSIIQGLLEAGADPHIQCPNKIWQKKTETSYELGCNDNAFGDLLKAKAPKELQQNDYGKNPFFTEDASKKNNSSKKNEYHMGMVLS